MELFRAFRIHEADGAVRAEFEQIGLESLTEGDVVIKIAYSTVNYKDALAATGKGKILRRYPLVGGVDLSGHVVSSDDDRFQEGDAVAVCGAGLSETHDGGYAEYTRVPAEFVVKLPQGLTLFDAMAIGTAGFTAAFAVQRMEENHQSPELGSIVVTGATGGVGSIAIDLLSGCGYDVAALTGKSDQSQYLTKLGANQIVSRNELEMGTRPLEKTQWGGAIDNVGGDVLSWLTRTVAPNGNIASIGLTGGVKLDTTVMPFILRGVSLLGINSVMVSADTRRKVWGRLATDLRPRHLERIVTQEIEFTELPGVFDAYIAGEVVGRTVVKIAQG